MNALLNYFNPWEATRTGQESADSLMRAALAGKAEREAEETKAAFGEMGQGEHFTGYEDVPGAKRPAYLRRLFAVNPQAALQMEQAMAAPYALQRDVQKAGQLEAAKKAADYEQQVKLLRSLGELPEPQAEGMPTAAPAPANAFLNYLKGAPTDTPETTVQGLPPGPWAAPEPSGNALNAALMPRPGLPQLGARERSVTMGPTGLSITSKTPSSLDVAGKLTDIETKRGGLNLETTKHTDELAQQDREYKRTIAKDTDESVHRLNGEIRQNKQLIREIQTDIQNNHVDPKTGQGQIRELSAAIAQAQRQRDALQRAPVPVETANPTILPSKGGGPSIPTPAEAPAPTSGLSRKQQLDLAEKGTAEKMTAANKEIANAREHAYKLAQYSPQVRELFDLVTKQDLGAPVVSNLPGGIGTTALMASPQYARLKNLNDALTNMFSQPGQSQLMNTIIERQMQAASVPGLGVEPQQNKKNAAILRSNVEHLKALPGFLEQWSKTHGGTLDGAAEEWIDFTSHNPRWTYKEDPRGKVTVTENRGAMSPDRWMTLKAQGRVKTLPDGRVLIQEPD